MALLLSWLAATITSTSDEEAAALTARLTNAPPGLTSLSRSLRTGWQLDFEAPCSAAPLTCRRSPGNTAFVCTRGPRSTPGTWPELVVSLTALVRDQPPVAGLTA
jgi:hypothetical protein